MSIEQLKYIVAVAKYKSFSIAAEKLFLSQSAISQSIIRLENELNVQLFDRTTTIINPTKHGDILINQANKILSELDYFKNLRIQLTKKNPDSIKIGVLRGIYLPFISSLIANAKKKEIELIYIEEDSLKLAKMLENNELDLAILALYPESLEYLQHTNYINSVPIDLYIFMSIHSKFSDEKLIHPHQLQGETLVLYDGPFTNWFTDKLQKQNGPLNILFESKNIELIRDATKNNHALALDTGAELIHNLPLDSKDIIAVPFEHHTIPKYHLGVAYVKQFNQKYLEDVANSLDKSIKTIFQK